MVIPVGKVVVPTPGTPVQLSEQTVYKNALAAAGISSQFKTVQAVFFQAWKGNTDEIYIGGVGMNRTTGEKVMAVLPTPSAGSNPSFGAANQATASGIDCDTLYIDADVGGEGVLVSLLVT